MSPDRPKGFGFKISWFALRTGDATAVADCLSLTSIVPSNWQVGLAAAQESSAGRRPGRVFVSPPIEGWTFAMGVGLPTPDDIGADDGGGGGARFRTLFKRLADRFGDAQFFASHRVSDFVAWAKAEEGTVIRVFAWAGSIGEVLANEGSQTPDEGRLGLLDLERSSPAEATALIFEQMERGEEGTPDEEQVVALAALWSIDPVSLEQRELPAGLGLLGAFDA